MSELPSAEGSLEWSGALWCPLLLFLLLRGGVAERGFCLCLFGLRLDELRSEYSVLEGLLRLLDLSFVVFLPREGGFERDLVLRFNGLGLVEFDSECP